MFMLKKLSSVIFWIIFTTNWIESKRWMKAVFILKKNKFFRSLKGKFLDSLFYL